jgi:ankyrin repeat protein
MPTREKQITLLVDAAREGDIDEFIEVLLANLEVIDGKDEYYPYCTALMCASRQGHAATVQLLLDHGAQVDVHDIEGDTALMLASYRGHTAIVQLLLDHVHL